MLSSLKSLFSPSPLKAQAYETYVALVEQSRQPIFYQQWHVEDTVDGRFDIIVLHLSLLISRLGQEGDANFSRYLQEAFFSDMDRSLREMGASDTGVGIRVKNMAQAFYGRMKAYEAAMGNETALREALKRNVYRDRTVAPEAVISLSTYMERNREALNQQSVEALQQGSIAFSH